MKEAILYFFPPAANARKIQVSLARSGAPIAARANGPSFCGLLIMSGSLKFSGTTARLR